MTPSDDISIITLADPNSGRVLTKNSRSPTGLQLPTGGTVGQVLEKNSSTDGDASWQTISSSGGSSTQKSVVEACATSDLSTNNGSFTYDNGTAGVGATLTQTVDSSDAGSLLVIDGYSVILNDFILLAGQTDQTQNGIYKVTNIGSAPDSSDPDGIAWVLTRANYYDTPADISAGDFVVVKYGTSGAGSIFVNTETDPIVIGTNAIQFQTQIVVHAGSFIATGSSSLDNGTILTNGAGTLTAVQFVGDGSELTGIPAQSTGTISAGAHITLTGGGTTDSPYIITGAASGATTLAVLTDIHESIPNSDLLLSGTVPVNAANSAGGNTALGVHALQLLDAGSHITAIGNNAMPVATTADGTVAVGSLAGNGDIDGTNNVYIGFEAGAANVHGIYNTIIGSFSNVTGVSANGQIAIGVLAIAPADNTIQIGTSNTAVITYTDVYFGDSTTPVLHAGSLITTGGVSFASGNATIDISGNLTIMSDFVANSLNTDHGLFQTDATGNVTAKSLTLTGQLSTNAFINSGTLSSDSGFISTDGYGVITIASGGSITMGGPMTANTFSTDGSNLWTLGTYTASNPQVQSGTVTININGTTVTLLTA